MARIEAWVRELHNDLDTRRKRDEAKRTERRLRIARLQRTVIDKSLPSLERVNALRKLREIPISETSSDGRTLAVAVAAAEIVNQAKDWEIREGALEGLRGLRYGVVKRTLLDSLSRDPDARVRSMAAGCLASFIGHRDVLVALERAAEADPEGSVKYYANEALKILSAEDR